jgi:hypothetical protein
MVQFHRQFKVYCCFLGWNRKLVSGYRWNRKLLHNITKRAGPTVQFLISLAIY